jgi:AdoMet-dependent rRNA methyltransferase SPB1
LLKAVARLNKIQAKAEAISENPDITERQKAESIKTLMRKAGKKVKTKEKITTVVAVGKNKGIAGRPAGVKGRYKV